MALNADGDAMPLEQYRPYLMVLAQGQWRDWFQGKLDPADIVQQTLLEAHAKKDQFRGNPTELAAWLRKILLHNVTDYLRKIKRGRRDVARERSIQAGIEDSATRFEEWLAAEQSTPSQRAAKNEQLCRLSEALAQLPALQRELIVLHHLHHVSLDELACRFERTPASVAGLLRRGMQRLRAFMQDGE